MKRLQPILCLLLLCESITVPPVNAVPTKSQKNKDSISDCRALVWDKSVDGNDDDDQMKGLSRLTVSVQRKHLLLPNIDFEAIKKAVEATCREAGLTVTNAENPRTPILAITMDCIGSGPGRNLPRDKQTAWLVTLKLLEPSILARDVKTRSLSFIYGHQRLKCVGELKATQADIEKEFLDSVAYFVAQWKKSNRR